MTEIKVNSEYGELVISKEKLREEALEKTDLKTKSMVKTKLQEEGWVSRETLERDIEKARTETIGKIRSRLKNLLLGEYLTREDLNQFKKDLLDKIDQKLGKEKQYECEQCGKAFDNRHSLSAHMKVHKKEEELEQDPTEVELPPRVKEKFSDSLRARQMYKVLYTFDEPKTYREIGKRAKKYIPSISKRSQTRSGLRVGVEEGVFSKEIKETRYKDKKGKFTGRVRKLEKAFYYLKDEYREEKESREEEEKLPEINFTSDNRKKLYEQIKENKEREFSSRLLKKETGISLGTISSLLKYLREKKGVIKKVREKPLEGTNAVLNIYRVKEEYR